MTAAHPDFVLFDDFLEPELHQALLAHALAQAGTLEPAWIYEYGGRQVDRRYRVADLCGNGLGALEARFVDEVMARFDAVTKALGIRRFAVVDAEVELVAHNDGAIYQRHIDTLTESDRPSMAGDRILSLVYYLHRRPKGFSGGELDLHSVHGGAGHAIEPRDNRLIAFPSYLPHEVRQVSCPSRAFADSRFAINMWLSRARRQG